MRRSKEALTLVLSVALSSCSTWWERKVVFPAPSPGTVLEIQQPFPANGWGVRVALKTRTITKVLYEIKGDVFLDFADGAWSTNGGTVAVFVCGTPSVKLAYDLSHGVDLPFVQVQSLVAAHIRSRYHLDSKRADEKGVFEWACSSDGKNAFLRAYPGASPR